MSIHDRRRSTLYRAERFGVPEIPQINDKRVSALYAEFDSLWRDWNHALDASETINVDTTLPDDLKKVRVKRVADSKVKAVDERVTSAIAAAETEIADIERTFESHLQPTSAASEMRRATLRQSLLNLPDGKRLDVVRDAIQNNDVALLDAVASGRPYESGTIALHFAEAREKLFEHQQPADFRALGLLKSGVKQLTNAALSFVDAVRDDLAPKDAEEIAERARKADAAANAGITNGGGNNVAQ